jgi:hypothetical protein
MEQVRSQLARTPIASTEAMPSSTARAIVEGGLSVSRPGWQGCARAARSFEAAGTHYSLIGRPRASAAASKLQLRSNTQRRRDRTAGSDELP